MQFKWTTSIHSAIYQDALNIRTTVFVNEQQVPIDIEIDDLEKQCHHVVAYIDNQPIATARIYPQSNYAKIQRVAVLSSQRGKNIGEKLMKEVEQKAKSLQFNLLKLGAQQHAIPFYEKLGYTPIGDYYEEAGIQHRDMQKPC